MIDYLLIKIGTLTTGSLKYAVKITLSLTKNFTSVKHQFQIMPIEINHLTRNEFNGPESS